jgi:aryl-alcohol dehydrogenase-like predicted oxidoreductase
MTMHRRQFIRTSAVAAGSLLLSVRSRAAEPATFDPFEKVPLGRTGLTASRMCLGTGMKGWKRESNHTRMGKEKFTELVRGAHERGVAFFDLADLYGTHTFFAEAMRGVPRDSYRLVSKIWWSPNGLPEEERPDADAVVERFLRELKTDHIDLVLLHCVQKETWPEDLRKQMDLLDGLKQKGVIRAHGVSCHTLAALRVAAKEPWVDSIHSRINPYGMVMDGPPEEVAPVLQEASKNGKGVIGMKLIGEGRFRDDDEKKDASLRYVLGLGAVDVLLVGCENLAEVDDFAARVRRIPRSA